jgi:hypothetical protein
VNHENVSALRHFQSLEENIHAADVTRWPNPACDGVSFSTGKISGQTREDLERRGAKTCLLGRWVDALEVAYPILWLTSHEASCETGSAQFTR